jgi:hypothetical protein
VVRAAIYTGHLSMGTRRTLDEAPVGAGERRGAWPFGLATTAREMRGKGEGERYIVTPQVLSPVNSDYGFKRGISIYNVDTNF